MCCLLPFYLVLHFSFLSSVFRSPTRITLIAQYSLLYYSIGLQYYTVNPTCVNVIRSCIAVNRTPSQSCGMILAIMGSHSLTCHPTQVNTPRLNPNQTGRYSIYLPVRDGRLSWPRNV